MVDGLGRRAGGVDVEAGVPERLPEDVEHGGGVVDEEDLHWVS
jgi:hypothetical protein